jgi:hypothetical protein
VVKEWRKNVQKVVKYCIQIVVNQWSTSGQTSGQVVKKWSSGQTSGQVVNKWSKSGQQAVK